MSNDETLEIPRLTGTIRAFSRVSQRYEELAPTLEKSILKRRMELDKAIQSNVATGLTLSKLAEKIAADGSSEDNPKLVSMLY